MEEITCKKCGKKIEGYTQNQIEHLMQQHMLMHWRKEQKALDLEKNENDTQK